MGRHRNRSALTRGFTLVEIIAVVAVIAILAALMVPSVIRRIDRAAWTAETENLSNLADALSQSIILTKTIPSYTNSATITNWASAIASQMSLPVSAITTNSRRYARAFLIDPTLRIGPSNNSVLPFLQTTNGSLKPVSARVMIVSSLARALPTNIVSGVASSNEFNAVWNTPEGVKPATWTTWPGSGDDLRVKKINLEPLFHQLILVNKDAPNPPGFSIDSTNTTSVLRDPLGWKTGNVYYLDGTVVGLHEPQPTSTVQARHHLKRSISFLFEAGNWRGGFEGSEGVGGISGTDFLNHAIRFFNHSLSPSTHRGASQKSVMLAMYTFMFDYTFWANECPHFDRHGNSGAPSAVPEYIMLNNQGQNTGNIDRFSLDLIDPP